jgi:ankyrin repeat protein
VNALAGTYNANVEAVDRYGKTALMLAAWNGWKTNGYTASDQDHTDTVNALAGTHNANVDAVDRYGMTALMLAASRGYTDTVNALAGTYNANVDAVNRNGDTALMIAARFCRTVNAMPNGPTDVVSALRRHGATR